MNGTSRHDEVLINAIVTFGQQTQEQVGIGEIGELLALFGRRAQGRDSHEEWVDEIADCTLVLRSFALMCCGDGQKIDKAVDAKANRLKLILETMK